MLPQNLVAENNIVTVFSDSVDQQFRQGILGKSLIY